MPSYTLHEGANVRIVCPDKANRNMSAMPDVTARAGSFIEYDLTNSDDDDLVSFDFHAAPPPVLTPWFFASLAVNILLLMLLVGVIARYRRQLVRINRTSSAAGAAGAANYDDGAYYNA